MFISVPIPRHSWLSPRAMQSSANLIDNVNPYISRFIRLASTRERKKRISSRRWPEENHAISQWMVHGKKKKRPRILGQISDCQEKDKLQTTLFLLHKLRVYMPRRAIYVFYIYFVGSTKWLLRRNKMNSACIEYSLWWNLRMQLP